MADKLIEANWVGRKIFWRVYFASLLLISVNMVQWPLAVFVGGYGLWDGFKDAFEYFSVGGYLFATGFRLIPYGLLGLAVRFSNGASLAKAFMAWFALLTIAGTHAWGYWVAQHAYYTDAHVSSTTAISFIFIPFYAAYYGAIAGVIGLLLGFIYMKFIGSKDNST